MSDALARAREADRNVAAAQQAVAAYAAVRAKAVRACLEAGMTQAEVGRELGISRQAVFLLLRNERA